MTDIQKQIHNFKKQNEGMKLSFQDKGINYTKLKYENIDPETELIVVKDYNDYLKNISKNNRPPPQQKEVKCLKVEKTPSVKKEKLDDSDNEDELTNEEKITFPTICNLEDSKRAFFSKEYTIFNELIQQQQLCENKLRFYKATYKWSDDNTGKPDFVARNLLRGFVQGLDPYRKYLMVCFRCILYDVETKTYIYPSYWIVNTTVDIKNLLGSLYDNYEFKLIEDNDVNKMLKKMEKNDNENDIALIGETYLH